MYQSHKLYNDTQHDLFVAASAQLALGDGHECTDDEERRVRNLPNTGPCEICGDLGRLDHVWARDNDPRRSKLFDNQTRTSASLHIPACVILAEASKRRLRCKLHNSNGKMSTGNNFDAKDSLPLDVAQRIRDGIDLIYARVFEQRKRLDAATSLDELLVASGL